MNQFFAPDEASANRCRRAIRKKPITIAGADPSSGRTKLYEGVVQSVEDHGATSKVGRRWRVTIDETR